MCAKILDHEERFKMWFERPFQAVQHTKHGRDEGEDWDGAFIAISIGLFLCERYYRTETDTHDDPPDPIPNDWDTRFKDKASEDWNMEREIFDAFWAVYRNGVQHQGMPRRTFRGYKGKKIWQRWDICLDYPDLPEVSWDSGEMVICLNPWGFTQLMIQKFLDNSPILEKGFTHAFGEVRSGKPYRCAPVVRGAG